MKRIALLALTLLVTSGGAGCKKLTEKVTEKAVEKATGGQVDIKNDGVTLKTTDKDGNEIVANVGSSAKVPADFPKEVPIYPGATVKGALSIAGGHTLSLATPDDAEKVVEYYKKSLSGFTQAAAADTGEGKMVSLKNATLSVNVSANRPAGSPETLIGLAVAPLKP